MTMIRFASIVLVFIFILSVNFVFSQTPDKNTKIGDTMLYTERDSMGPAYSWVEEMPHLEGGKDALNEFIHHYPYPECGLKANLEGLVVLQFIVEKDGTTSNVHVVRSPDPCLSEAALLYFNKIPTWKPGKYNGKIVACYFTLPITYNINEYKSRMKKE